MMRLITASVLTVLLSIGGLFLTTGDAKAQLNVDPSTLTLPDFTQPDPDRAVVISVFFNSSTDLQPENIIIANVRARGSLGAPSLIRLELLDINGNVLREQDAWHPLWVRDWDDTEQESGSVLPAGPGTFYVPLIFGLSSVRISDVPLDLELLTVDVTAAVLAFCTANPQSPLCSYAPQDDPVFQNGFEAGSN